MKQDFGNYTDLIGLRDVKKILLNPYNLENPTSKKYTEGVNPMTSKHLEPILNYFETPHNLDMMLPIQATKFDIVQNKYVLFSYHSFYL